MAKSTKTTQIIDAPAAREILIQKDGVTVRARVAWNRDFVTRVNGRWSKAQAKFSMEVARKIEPYVPFQTGMLKSSVAMASDFESGQLVYNTPYARSRYYQAGGRTNGLRGSYWGKRAIADHKDHLAKFGAACIKEAMSK
jgi:hypothetical protein